MKSHKRILSLFLFIVLLCLCGCAEKTAPYCIDDAEALLSAGVFDGHMTPVDGEVLLLLYGIDKNTVIDCVGYQAINSSVSADEVVVLILDDEDAAREAETACKRRVENQLRSCQSYCPAAVPHLEAAVVHRIENTVLLAVGDPDLLPDAVKALHPR